MKNKVLIAVLIVALFIPTYIGIFNYINTTKTPVSVDSATALTISDIAGKTYEAKADSDIAVLLNKINSSAIKLQTPPEILSGSDYFKVTFADGKRATEYRYFFSLNTSAVYYLDADGVSYLVSEEDAEAFLATQYAQSLYKEAYLPQLINGENSITPANYSWSYLLADGKSAMASTLADTTDTAVSYTSRNGLSLQFEREPQSFAVTVKSADGTILYSGDYSALAGQVDTKANSVLTVEATAEWVGNEEHMSSGKASYTFLLNIEEQTAFFISSDTVLPGGLIAVTATNITNKDDITFTCEPALTHGGKTIAPVFYADGTRSYALLPTTYETLPGTYTLTFGYNGINQQLQLTVTEKTFKTQAYDVAKATVSATRTAATIASYDKLVQGVITGDFSTRYFDGLFNMGIAEEGYNGTVMTGYGLTRRISATDESYRHDGVDFYAKDGSTVIAVNAGKVIYVGASEYSGVLVAIDHGYGLISWYGNLSKATVKVGDIVAAGDTVAVSGSTGFTKGNSLHVGLTVFDVPVCPYDLWETPLAFN